MDLRTAKRLKAPTRWADVFVARMDQLKLLVADNGCGPRERRHRSSVPTSLITLVRGTNG
ncbi:unnamed protein product [Strongylus vulgaris]|uniref:Uncharacterized protein n=1 Tax=Strongylus vulgaris TaxID=40348 RepID=A0A3P7JB95_STRVU|nr:unnamed protein product [Strongylus vulgaris]